MDVIGVAGQAQNGKDTFADYLAATMNTEIGHAYWHRSAFARNVKRIYCETFDKDYEFIEQYKMDPNPPPGMDMCVRKALQFIGDGFRTIKGSIWVDLMFRHMEQPTIISDVRYPNELKAVKEHQGINILVVRPERLNDDPNGSEAHMRPLADWALANWPKPGTFTNLSFVPVQPYIRNEGIIVDYDGPLYSLKYVDFMILNDGDVESFHKNIDTMIPIINWTFKHQGK